MLRYNILLFVFVTPITLVNRLDCRRKGAKGFYLGGQATVVKSPVIGCAWRTDSSACSQTANGTTNEKLEKIMRAQTKDI
jgi:hypothetical protein